MTLIRWNPDRNLSTWDPTNHFAGNFFNVGREFDRMVERLRGDATIEGQASPWLPAVDILENNETFEVNIELPGMKKEDVKITLHDDILTVRGEKKKESEKKDRHYRRVERSYGMFQRSFTLPETVKSDKIDASFEEGILTLLLPKSEESKPRDIEVKVK